MATKKPAPKKAPAKKAAAKTAAKKPAAKLAAAPATPKPAEEAPKTPTLNPETEAGTVVFYNPSTEEQEMHNLPARAQGFIEHGLADGRFKIRLTDVNGNPFSKPAFYHPEPKTSTFQLG